MRHRPKHSLLAIAAACVLATVAGCGGGGGGGGGGGAGIVGLPIAAPPPAQSPAPVEKPPECSVTLYGDSVLYGYTDAGRLAEPPAAALKRLMPAMRVVDHSTPGDYLLLRMPKFMNDDIDTRFVVIQHGLNDAGNGFSYETPLRTMAQRVKSLGRTLVVTGISRVKPEMPNRQPYDDIARRVASEEGALFADWGAVRFDPAEMTDDVHPAQPYSVRLTERLVSVLSAAAPECAK